MELSELKMLMKHKVPVKNAPLYLHTPEESQNSGFYNHTPLVHVSVTVSVCTELLSFDYAQINLAIQPRSVDFSPLYIHQNSTQRCRNSHCNINTRWSKTLQPANNQSGKLPTERMIDQDWCCYCSAVSLLSSLCQGSYEMIS